MLPNWATQPEAHYDPSTSSYVLLHSRFASFEQRSNGTSKAAPCDKDGRGHTPEGHGGVESNISLAFAPSLDGPWTCCIDVALGEDLYKNPSLLVHTNGSAVMVWRGLHGVLATAFAPNVRGPYRRATQTPAVPVSVVDPHILWLDEPPSYHIISTEGGHHWSHDAINWHNATAPIAAGGGGGDGSRSNAGAVVFGPAFNGTVSFSPTVKHTYGTRECPKLVQKGGVGGTPILLSSVVQRFSSSECGPCPSSTIVQQIGDTDGELFL